jgi:hypothetical protein
MKKAGNLFGGGLDRFRCTMIRYLRSHKTKINTETVFNDAMEKCHLNKTISGKTETLKIAPGILGSLTQWVLIYVKRDTGCEFAYGMHLQIYHTRSMQSTMQNRFGKRAPANMQQVATHGATWRNSL